MNKKQLIVGGAILFFWSGSALAYYDNYPPYKFNQTPYKQLDIESIAEADCPQFIRKNYDKDLLPQVYRFDIDGNGLQDSIVLLQIGANSFIRGTDIYLQRLDGGYQKISYEGSGNGIEDFVDINQDGKYEVIITGMYYGKEHNYFTYSIYEIKDYRLVNADLKFRGFPKFVWITNNPNDKDTIHLTKDERAKHAGEKNKSISYEMMK